jgi:hypothetical protein
MLPPLPMLMVLPLMPMPTPPPPPLRQSRSSDDWACITFLLLLIGRERPDRRTSWGGSSNTPRMVGQEESG